MPIPPIQKQLAIKQIEKYCKNMVPAHVQYQVASKYELEKNMITLIESRPKWDDEAIHIGMQSSHIRHSNDGKYGKPRFKNGETYHE